jgi:hypothetical protein
VPQWKNPLLTVYHGTDNSAAVIQAAPVGGRLPFVVNLALCRSFTDFGQGFYTSTSLHQAKQWANTRVLRTTGTTGSAVVLRFEIHRDWLASLDTLAFVRAIADFWALVADCRVGFPPHQRQPPHPVPYDVVYGPVTLWPQILIISDCDQISFHTQKALGGLNTVFLEARATYLF